MATNQSKLSFAFHPKILDTLRNYSRHDFLADLAAGITVGIIALSLAMALGIASERSPAIGIYTAIIAGFLTSALGGSRVQIGGPTAAFIPIVVGVGVTYGLDNLVICTLLAGALLIAMGAARGDDQVYPVAGHCGLHGRDRSLHLQYAGEGIPRAPSGQSSGGLSRKSCLPRKTP